MTREMAIEELQRHKQEFAHDHGWSGSVLDALDAAISALRKIRYLDGRPCEVCSCHNDNGCGVWNCVFDGKESV